jgi:hypothetical protein
LTPQVRIPKADVAIQDARAVPLMKVVEVVNAVPYSIMVEYEEDEEPLCRQQEYVEQERADVDLSSFFCVHDVEESNRAMI